jgi:hypothetical protein
MVKLKKYSVKKTICEVCSGNGYVKVVHINKKNHVHQCWQCDSEGEYYVYNPTSDSSDNNSTDHYNSNPFLH